SSDLLVLYTRVRETCRQIRINQSKFGPNIIGIAPIQKKLDHFGATRVSLNDLFLASHDQLRFAKPNLALCRNREEIIQLMKQLECCFAMQNEIDLLSGL